MVRVLGLDVVVLVRVIGLGRVRENKINLSSNVADIFQNLSAK